MTNELTILKTPTIQDSRFNIELEMEEFFKLEDYRGETSLTYRKGIRCFVNWIKENNITGIDKATLLTYKKYLGETYSVRTANTYLSGLRCLFNYLSEKGIDNLMVNIKNFKVKKGFAKLPFPVQKFIEITETLKEERHDEATYRDYAIFMLAVVCMLREIEISRIDIEDIICIDGLFVSRIQGKGRDEKDEIAVLVDEVLEAITDYLKIRGQDSFKPLFTSLAHNHKGERLTTRSIRRNIKNILVRFKLDSKYYTTHSCRHSGATYLTKSGEATLQEIQETLRHQDINTTTIYSHIDNRTSNPMERVMLNYLRKEREKYYGITQGYINS